MNIDNQPNSHYRFQDILDAYFPQQGTADVIGIREFAMQQEKETIRRTRNERLRKIALGVGSLTVYIGGIAAAAWAQKAQEETNLAAFIADLKVDIDENQRLMDECEAELQDIRQRKAAKAERRAARKAARKARKS